MEIYNVKFLYTLFKMDHAMLFGISLYRRSKEWHGDRERIIQQLRRLHYYEIVTLSMIILNFSALLVLPHITWTVILVLYITSLLSYYLWYVLEFAYRYIKSMGPRKKLEWDVSRSLFDTISMEREVEDLNDTLSVDYLKNNPFAVANKWFKERSTLHFISYYL